MANAMIVMISAMKINPNMTETTLHNQNKIKYNNKNYNLKRIKVILHNQR